MYYLILGLCLNNYHLHFWKLFVKLLEKCQDIKWHFIGHIQKNKVSKLLLVPGLHVIETIDSEKLASAVNDGWKKLNKENRLKIMVQVNTSNEKGYYK